MQSARRVDEQAVSSFCGHLLGQSHPRGHLLGQLHRPVFVSFGHFFVSCSHLLYRALY